MAKLFYNKDISIQAICEKTSTVKNVSLEDITSLSLDVQALDFKLESFTDGLEASVEEFHNLSSINPSDGPGVFMQAAYAASRRLGVSVDTISTESINSINLSTEGLLNTIWEGIKRIIKKVVEFIKTMWDKFLKLIGLRKQKIVNQMTKFDKLKAALKFGKKVSKEDFDDPEFDRLRSELNDPNDKEFQALREQLAHFKSGVEYKELMSGLEVINKKAPEIMSKFEANEFYKFLQRDKVALEHFLSNGIRIYSLFGLTLSETFTNKGGNAISAMRQKYTNMKKLMHQFAWDFETLAGYVSISAAKDPTYSASGDKELDAKIKKCHDSSLKLVELQLSNIDVELKDPSVLNELKNNQRAIGFLKLDMKAEVGDIGISKSKIIGHIEVFADVFEGVSGKTFVSGIKLKDSVLSRIEKEIDSMWNVTPETNVINKNLECILAVETTVKELGFVLEDLEVSGDRVFDKIADLSNPTRQVELEMSNILKILHKFVVAAQSVIKTQYSGSRYILDVYDLATKLASDYAEFLVHGK